jgi:hypothetical protein
MSWPPPQYEEPVPQPRMDAVATQGWSEEDKQTVHLIMDMFGLDVVDAVQEFWALGGTP